MTKELIGEALGTGIIVLIGCGSVGAAVILGILTALWQVAIIFGMGVTVAIIASRGLCPSHLNPAVSFSMCIRGLLPWKKLIPYSIAQLIGAFIGAAILYLLFKNEIETLEAARGILRGTPESLSQAMMFGEYFPNPDFADKISIGWFHSMLIEAFGTFILLSSIYLLIAQKGWNNNLIAFLIGLTVTVLIIFLAPYTQGGFNPARDFGPRVFSYFAGWGEIVFAATGFGFFSVYILGPLVGGALAGVVWSYFYRA